MTDVSSLFANINTWARKGQRAPHKPLLLLWMLARVQRGEGRLAEYREIAPALKRLLLDFGPSRKSWHPEYPFWRLQNDGFWEVPEREEAIAARASAKRTGDVPHSVLLKVDAHGGFDEAVFELLRGDRGLVNRLVGEILEAHFPESSHEAILDAVGMPWVAKGAAPRARRDPRFREVVLRGYEYRCAACGLDLRLGANVLGIEAAHVRWHSHGGPDELDNGLALCVLHHRALDRGAIGIDDDLRMLVSRDVVGSDAVADLIVSLHGRPLRTPQERLPTVRPEYARWHRKEVFRTPAR